MAEDEGTGPLYPYGVGSMTSEPDPYTRAQELRDGAEPTSQERIALQAHLDMREFTPTFNRIVATHLTRMTIKAILAR